MNQRFSRRQFLALSTGGVAALAGCLGQDDAREAASQWESDEVDTDEIALPIKEQTVPLAHSLGAYDQAAVSGGVGQDGIPSIDQPEFGDVETGDELLAPDDPVFGVELDGTAKAYPQHVLVHHEIVNDTFGKRGIAVTYCPLTGTVVGFERGSVELGVSGQLVNNNLIMYDRETNTWWPQVLATGVLGQLKSRSLHEVRVTWTTWERWKTANPETDVLTEETGFARDYDYDPYGDYNPRSGYYADDNVNFSLMEEDDRHPRKAVFIGGRSRDGAVVFEKELLRDEHLLETTVGDVPYVGVYQHALDSAYIYHNPDGETFEPAGEEYEGPDGDTYAADSVPLESVNEFDGMWFAWVGFYPDLTVVDGR